VIGRQVERFGFRFQGGQTRMARISPLPDADLSSAARALLDQQRAAHGRVTNMKQTLAHSPVALRALMQWYDLHAEVVAFLGTRPAMLFVHAISSQTDCLICSTFFRRWLIESGDDPDAPALNEREQTLIEFGRQLARDANAVSDDLFARLRSFLEPAQLVTLTAFGGLMIATNVFNNALRVDLDEYLFPYRKEASR
jgi:alkylhydroperoxidase family enzyme